MKNKKKVFMVLITVAVLTCTTGITANAAAQATSSANGLNASYNVAVVATDGTTSTKVFEGVSVTVLDKTTPAVNVRGRTNDRTVMCFVSAADQEVGVVSHKDYNTIIQKNQKVVNLPGGGTYGAPPIDGQSWETWFADEFNKYRGLVAGSREEAVKANTAETIQDYRQEVIKLVNAEREKAGLSALFVDEKAMDYAQVRAQELVTSYSHTRPDGLKKPYDEIGAMNENIARGQGTPMEVVEDWMNSPGHRANILNKDAFAIGVGCYWTGSEFRWVQEFLW